MKKFLLFVLMIHLCISAFAQTTQQADSLHQKGRELMNEGKIVEGRECTRQAMEIGRAHV